MSRERRFLFITHARSASNLLMRMMTSKQQNVKHAEYNFNIDAIEMIRKFKTVSFEALSPEEQKQTMEGYDAMVQRVKTHFATAAEEGKIATDKEHAIFMLRPQVQYQDQQDTLAFLQQPESTLKSRENGIESRAANPTVVDDEFLKSVTPIFLIRHPALMIPSYARVAEDFQYVPDATMKHNRMLYDWYVKEMPEAEKPMIVNATDYMSNPELLRHLASRMGLDPEQVAFSWTAASDEEIASWPEIRVKMTKTLAESTEIMKDKLKLDIDIDAEEEKWKNDFGEEKATTIKWLVQREMPDFEYLMEKRITLN